MYDPTITLQDIEAMNCETLTPTQIAPVLGYNPHSIRLQARLDASVLGFPVVCVGSRVRIPRRAFIRFMRGTREEETAS